MLTSKTTIDEPSPVRPLSPRAILFPLEGSSEQLVEPQVPGKQDQSAASSIYDTGSRVSKLQVHAGLDVRQAEESTRNIQGQENTKPLGRMDEMGNYVKKYKVTVTI